MWIIFLLTLITSPLILFLVYEYQRKDFRKAINCIPGPKAIPLLGNAHKVGKNGHEIFKTLFKCWFQYGKKNFRLWVGLRPVVYIVNSADMEYILTSTTLLRKSPVYNLLHPWLGQGLLTAYGTRWHSHRKMITPSFHFKILQIFHETMNKNSTKFIQVLTKTAKDENIFDFQEIVHFFTLDLICDTAMGVNINAMENNDSELVAAFKEMCNNVNIRAFKPLQRNYTLFKLAPDYPKYKKALTTLQDFTYDIIEKRIAARENQEISINESDENVYFRQKLAFLDTLLTATIDGRPLTNQEIYEEVSTFIFEGHDTTSSAISFMVYILSLYPEIQKKLYDEQVNLFGNNMNRDPTYQEISEMNYLDLTLKETLRMFPSVPIIGRHCEHDIHLSGQLVPRGSVLNMFIMALGYSEKIFKDPFVCRPERFENQDVDNFGYVPFSAGPRNCIGQKFAALEIKTVMSKIVRNFEILPALDGVDTSEAARILHVQNLLNPEDSTLSYTENKYDPQLSMILTLKSDNGIHVRLKKRQYIKD